jgi:hypothetical protein
MNSITSTIKKTKSSKTAAVLLLATICYFSVSCGKFTGSVQKNVAYSTYVYAGPTSGGLSISQDGGISWVTTTKNWNGFANSSIVGCIFASGRNVYACTFAGGLSISSDGGLSWVTTTKNWNGFANNNQVNGVFASGKDVYVATSSGLSISNDGGLSWVTTTKNWNGFGNGNQVFSVFAQAY